MSKTLIKAQTSVKWPVGITFKHCKNHIKKTHREQRSYFVTGLRAQANSWRCFGIILIFYVFYQEIQQCVADKNPVQIIIRFCYALVVSYISADALATCLSRGMLTGAPTKRRMAVFSYRHWLSSLTDVKISSRPTISASQDAWEKIRICLWKADTLGIESCCEFHQRPLQ